MEKSLKILILGIVSLICQAVFGTYILGQWKDYVLSDGAAIIGAVWGFSLAKKKYEEKKNG